MYSNSKTHSLNNCISCTCVCKHMCACIHSASVYLIAPACLRLMYEAIIVEMIRDPFYSIPYALINSTATASPTPSNR